jgi:hypothetical protein
LGSSAGVDATSASGAVGPSAETIGNALIPRFFDLLEAGYAIAWLRKQHWCDGRVGTY